MAERATTFIDALAEACRGEPLREKWLIAPTLRVGYQWLDRVVLSGVNVLNCRIKTLRGMALDAAAARMEGRTFLRGIREERLVAGLFADFQERGGGYLFGLAHTEGLTGSLMHTLRDLRLSDMRAGSMDVRDFEVEAKGGDWIDLLAAYEKTLAEEKLSDFADVLRTASRWIEDFLSPRALVLHADAEELSVLERRFLDAVPPGRGVRLPPASMEIPPTERLSLKHFRAMGEANEVREVLRDCMEKSLPFDDVEIICTDPSTYVPLVYELSRRLAPEEALDPPVTFEDGIPLRYTRPGRALLSWLDWIREGCPRHKLLPMFRDLLIDAPDGIGEEAPIPEARIDGSSPRSLLEAAHFFVKHRARHANRHDEYGLRKLLRQIDELTSCLDRGEDPAGLDVMEWLARITRESTIGGEGPRPGCLYVSGLSTGGHSGRGNTYLLGLDDSRFPGEGLQDPLLLDNERRRISKTGKAVLPLAAQRRERKSRNFRILLARLSGSVTFGYSCRSLADDREMFPSPALSSVLRETFEESASDFPASFAPRSEDGCLDEAEWWLGRLFRDEDAVLPESIFDEHFPHLARGRRAGKARSANGFTEYDGCVPEAGAAHNPFLPGGPVLSASGLETLGRCPMEYFFKYVLDVRPMEKYLIDPRVWLDPMRKGELLHQVFREFMQGLVDEGALPAFDRHEEKILGVLERRVQREKEENPPPGDAVFEREMRELVQTSRIFLFEEEVLCRTSRPRFLEVAVGFAPGPVTLVLPGGRKIRARGRIDRIDLMRDSPGDTFYLWDYKTGSPGKYRRDDPFRQGRFIQSALYLRLAEAWLREEVSPEAGVKGFGYFFPNVRVHGERMRWMSETLASGGEVLSRLCELVAQGCFPFSDKEEDAWYSDYGSAFGDPRECALNVNAMLDNEACPEIGPFRRLRGHGE